MKIEKKKKKNKLKRFLMILIPVIILFYFFLEPMAYKISDKIYEKKIDIYAEVFCNGWEQYVFDYNLTIAEEKALGLYFFIDENIVEENQEPSYVECCEHLNMTCNWIELKDEEIVAIYVKNTWRYIDFHNTHDIVLENFFKYYLDLNETS